VVLTTGRLNLREETPKIVANDIMSVESIYKMISGLNINLSGVQENLFESLKGLLAQAHGEVPIYLHLDTAAKSRVQVVVDQGLFVRPSEKLISDIESLLGEERLSLVI